MVIAWSPGVTSEIAHIRQPTDATCVQACLAMYLRKPITEVLVDLPHRDGGTTHKKMIAYLRAHGIPCDKRLTSARGKQLPERAIVRITWPDDTGHVVLKNGPTWHDPQLNHPFTGICIDWSWKQGRITSFLALP